MKLNFELMNRLGLTFRAHVICLQAQLDLTKVKSLGWVKKPNFIKKLYTQTISLDNPIHSFKIYKQKSGLPTCTKLVLNSYRTRKCTS